MEVRRALIIMPMLVLGVVVPSTLLAADIPQKQDNGGVRSILQKLDFKRVGFSMQTQPELTQRLRERAIARLKKAGLEPAAIAPNSQIDAVLVLTIDPIPLGKICPGKVLYDTKIQLRDDVIIQRDRDIRVEAITWSFAPGSPSLVGIMPIEKLEADADRYIDQFITSYGLEIPRSEMSRSPIQR
jgi:hypothetical protein